MLKAKMPYQSTFFATFPHHNTDDLKLTSIPKVLQNAFEEHTGDKIIMITNNRCCVATIDHIKRQRQKSKEVIH